MKVCYEVYRTEPGKFMVILNGKAIFHIHKEIHKKRPGLIGYLRGTSYIFLSGPEYTTSTNPVFLYGSRKTYMDDADFMKEMALCFPPGLRQRYHFKLCDLLGIQAVRPMK